MAKDALGHGSAPKFGDYAKSKLGEKYIIARPTDNNRSRYPGYNFVTPGQHEAVKASYRSDHPEAAAAYFGANNSDAARSLSGGAKSAAAPVHDGMNTDQWGTHNAMYGRRASDDVASTRESNGRHGYNAAAVNNAIASSNRSGRRIGGKEASAIHRLLKGR